MPGFYKTPDGEIVGPISGAEIRRLVQEGRLGLTTSVSPSADGPWKRLDQVPDLEERSAAATPPPIPITLPRVAQEAQATELTRFVGRFRRAVVRALAGPVANHIVTVAVTVVVVMATLWIVGSGRNTPIPSIAEGGSATVDVSSVTSEIPQMARATFLWLGRAGKLEITFNESFAPVWRTTRESQDEAAICDAYTKVAEIIGDFAGKLEAIPSNNLDPDLREYSFEKLAFLRRLQANCLGLARSVSKIRQLKAYAQSPEAVANAFVMGLAGDPSGGTGRLVQLQLEYANEYNALVDQQTAFAGDQASLEERRVRLQASLEAKYGRYAERLEREFKFDEE